MRLSIILFAALFTLSAITITKTKSYASSGMASWYDCSTPGQCSKSKRTASGEIFNAGALTAAHRSLPFGTKVRVTHKGKSVVVRINDRGPFVKGRHIDLSRAAARQIGCKGVCKVTMVVLK